MATRASGSARPPPRRCAPRPARRHERVGLAALGALLRDRQREAAVVAVEAAAIAVLDQPGRALRAIDAMAAGAAQRERRVAAAVEVEQRLLLRGERLGHGLDEDGGEPFAALGRMLAQVDGRHVRQLGARIAAGQVHVAVAAGAGVDVAFDRGRGGGEDDRELGEIAAHDGHVAGLVVDAVLLLEAGVVLLVDDDQAELAVGQEESGAGADDDTRLASGRRAPGACALARRQGRVPFHRRAAEAALEAVHELAGERDLGQHDERLPSLLEGARHGLEVDLGLAGAGDAVEQRDGEGVGAAGGAHGVRGGDWASQNSVAAWAGSGRGTGARGSPPRPASRPRPGRRSRRWCIAPPPRAPPWRGRGRRRRSPARACGRASCARLGRRPR